MNGKEHEIGVSIISLIPLCLPRSIYAWNDFHDRAINMAREAGLAGVQLLPIRGLEANLPKYRGLVISLEDAWGASIIDRILFGQPGYVSGLYKQMQAFFPDAIVSSHQFDGIHPVEVYPGLSKRAVDYEGYAKGIVLDTYHLFEIEGSTGRSIDRPDIILEQIPPEQVKLIHVQPGPGMEERFIKRRDTLSNRVLRRLRGKVNGPLILEVRPSPELIISTAMRSKTGVEFLKALVNVTAEDLGW